MANDARGDGSQGEATQSLGPAWQPDRGIYDVLGRLSRSASLALILSPIGLIFVSVTRLLIVSDYNPVTASAIASSGGYVDTLLGTIIPLLPVLAPYIALILLFFNRTIAAILAFAATAFVSPIAINRASAVGLAGKDWHLITHSNLLVIVIMLLFAVAFALLLSLELMTLGLAVSLKTVATIACIVLIPFIARLYPLPLNSEFYAEQVKQPWLPPETIMLNSGQSFTGYVLDDDGSWLVVLGNSSRTVNYYPGADVTSRKVCRIGLTLPTEPLITFFPAGLHAPTHTPPCEASSSHRPSPAITPKTHPS